MRRLRKKRKPPLKLLRKLLHPVMSLKRRETLLSSRNSLSSLLLKRPRRLPRKLTRKLWLKKNPLKMLRT